MWRKIFFFAFFFWNLFLTQSDKMWGPVASLPVLTWPTYRIPTRKDRLPSEGLKEMAPNIQLQTFQQSCKFAPFVFPVLRTFVLCRSAEGLTFGHYKHSCKSGGIWRNVLAFFGVESASSAAEAAFTRSAFATRKDWCAQRRRSECEFAPSDWSQ